MLPPAFNDMEPLACSETCAPLIVTPDVSIFTELAPT
jgi:hypothetical protein